MSKEFPSQFGRSEQYRNPDQTLPMPSPQNIPRPVWNGARVAFAWSPRIVGDQPDAVIPPGFVYTYAWTSPVFDLRPDLRSSQGAAKQGVPIWSTSARLYVQLFSPNGSIIPANLSLAAEATDFAQVVAAQQQSRVGEGFGTPPNVVNIGTTDVTSKFAPSGLQESVLAGFAPPGTTLGFGDGYPIRYWRLRVTFSQYIETGLPIPPVAPLPYAGVNLQASVY